MVVFSFQVMTILLATGVMSEVEVHVSNDPLKFSSAHKNNLAFARFVHKIQTGAHLLVLTKFSQYCLHAQILLKIFSIICSKFRNRVL